MSSNSVRRFAIAAAFLGLALAQTPAAFALSYGGTFQDRLYAGCVTKAELFEAVRTYGAVPKKLIKVENGIAIIRGKEMGKQYDFYVLACQLMVDGRQPV